VVQPPAQVDGSVPLSCLICYDLDYSDYVRAVTRHGGVLVAPSNDWREYADLHDGLALWGPVMTGVPLVRCTGHGISAIFDSAGRRLAAASSFEETVVLVADVPLVR
jgi:apolipoprotein N-acyltransferase